jgi:hypothetical protein
MNLVPLLAAWSAPPPAVDPIPRMVEEITRFLILSGLTWQSVQGIETERWARDLLKDGITHVPDPRQPKTYIDILVINRLSEMMHDAACARAKRNGDTWGVKMHAWQAHEIRDLRARTDPSAKRRYKGSKPRRYLNS